VNPGALAVMSEVCETQKVATRGGKSENPTSLHVHDSAARDIHEGGGQGEAW
jgi:hypothetical protein